MVWCRVSLPGLPSNPITSWRGDARSVQLNPSVTTPYTWGTVPLTASRPSTRTMVPIPTGESMAVQKWNSCGVFGRRSVATTRPSGMTRRLEKNAARDGALRSADGAQELFAVPDAVGHLVPPPVRQGNRGRLGEHPSGNLVGARAHGSGIRKFGGLDP